MSINAKALICMKFASERQLSTLLNALEPETHVMENRRVNVILQKEGCFLKLVVESEDTIALRATLNAYLRWIQSAIKVIQFIETY